MLNRTLYLIKSFLQNSKINKINKINKMNFIKNYKIYNEKKIKNIQLNNSLVLKRKFSSFKSFMMNGGSGGSGNDLIYLTAIIIGLYFSFKN
jgi:hypothetical protein